MAIIFTEVRALKIIKPEQVHVQQAERYLHLFISSFSFGQVIDHTLNSNKLKLTHHFPLSPPLLNSVHLRIHVPEIVQKHKHVKTKFVHVYHPKIIATDIHHSPSLSFYSRKDPNNYDVVSSGSGHYSNPLFKQKKSKNELKLTANDFYRWRQDQAKKSIDHHHKRNVAKPSIYEQDEGDDDVNNEQQGDLNHDLDDEEAFDESERYSQSSNNHDNFHKGNSPSSKHKNHKYHATSAEKSLHNYSNRHQWDNSNKQRKPTSSYHQNSDRTRKNKSSSKSRHKYQQPQLYPLESQQHLQVTDSDPTNTVNSVNSVQPQYLKTDVSQNIDVNDPTFYSTLPKNPVNTADHDDDIYSGLLSSKPSKMIVEKSKLLGDINYNRKQRTKIFTAQNKIQKQQSELLKSSKWWWWSK